MEGERLDEPYHELGHKGPPRDSEPSLTRWLAPLLWGSPPHPGGGKVNKPHAHPLSWRWCRGQVASWRDLLFKERLSGGPVPGEG